MTVTLTTNTSLDLLIDRLDRAVHGGRPGWSMIDAVSAALAPALGKDDLLSPGQRIGDPSGYRQHVLHTASDGMFSLAALVWLPGQSTPIHDHLSWCVVGVHEGNEVESRYLLADGYLIEYERAEAQQGSVGGLMPPGDIHRVTNSGGTTTVSLHVYGADLSCSSSSIRRRYDLPVIAARR